MVTVTVGSRTSNEVPFTYTYQLQPVITQAAQGWNDGRGFSLTVKNLPSDDALIHLFVNGVRVKFDHVSRANGSFSDPNAGDRALVSIPDTTISDHVPLNFAH